MKSRTLSWAERKYSKDSTQTPAICYSERLCLGTDLAINYSQTRVVFCCQHQTKLFVNNNNKHSFLSYLNPGFLYRKGTQYELLPKSVLPKLQF